MTRRELGKPMALLVAVVVLLGGGLPAAHAGLERVGPTVVGTGGHGYPGWYQDTTGLTLEFCSPLNQAELADGWCLLLPADTVAPEQFPTAFADEHFYWAADAGIDFTANGVAGRARLILGLEAAFAQGPVVNGDQIVFGRIRIRINDLPYSGTYTVYTPYGVYVFENQLAGERLFYTEDIGFNCPTGQFDCALDSNLGPFLLPASQPGGGELPAVTSPSGKLHIADPARGGPVTGSPLPPFTSPLDGVTRNHNIFRIEGPNGFVIQTTDFTLMGRVLTAPIPAKVTLDRASYARSAASGNKLDVFATGLPGMQGRLPGAPKPPAVAPDLAFYPAPCGVDALTDALGAPTAVARVPMARVGTALWAQVQPAVIPPSVCVEDANGPSALFVQVPVTDDVTIMSATYNPANGGQLTVRARSSDEVSAPAPGLSLAGFGLLDPMTGQITIAPLAAPPAKAKVLSDAGGIAEFPVTTSWVSVNSAPTASNFTVVTPENTPVATTLSASDPDGNPLTYAIVSAPAHGVLSGTAPNLTYTPNANYSGPDSFTFKANDGLLDSNIATVTITVDPVNHLPVANADRYTTAEDTLLAVVAATGVLANDTDVDGQTLTAVLVSGPASGTVNLSADGSFTYTPAPNFNGTATFTYRAQDSAGASSAAATVTITVTPVNDPPAAVNDSFLTAVNDPPSFTAGPSQTVTQPAGAQTVTSWATSISAGPPDEAATQTVSFLVSNDNPALFSGQPAVAANGTLTYTPAAGASGSATVSVQAQDSGGTANGGVNTSAPQIFTITVNPAPAAADPIFQDGFESGSLAAWSAASGGLDLSVTPAAAMGGSTRGLAIEITPWDQGPRYVQDTTPVAEPRYRARFYFHPNSISMLAEQAHAIMAARNASVDVARIEFQSNGLDYQIRASVRSNAGTYVSSAWYSITDAPHAIEIDWRAATTTTATDGSLTLWIDGVLRQTVANIANGTLRVDEARLGPLGGVPGGTAGTEHFDGFVSRRATLIGP